MAEQTFASYSVFFSTVDKANYAISFVGGLSSFLRIKPSDAAAMFGLTWPLVGGPRPLDGFLFLFPYLPGSNIRNPAPSGVILDGNLDDFAVPGQVIGGGWTPSPDRIVSWSMGITVLGPDYDGGDPLLIAPIPPRRWAMGWEGSTDMELHPNASTGNRARDASRVVDGLGLKWRGEASTAVECLLSNSEGTGLPSRESWERFYIRVRTAGAITGEIWRCTGTAATTSGARLVINPDRTITCFNVNNAGVNTATFGTIPALVIDTWYKVDILAKFATGVLNGTLRVYINGILSVSGVQGTGSDGLGQIQNYRSTILMTFGVTSTWEIDIDDWHNAEVPGIAGVEVLNSIDFLTGTHVRASYVSPGTVVNWTGILQAMNGYINPAGSALTLTATIANSVIDLLTNLSDYDTAENQDATGMNMGAATVAVSINGSQAGGAPNNGQLGYKIAGGAAVLTATALAGAPSNVTETYLPSGSLVPYPIAPFSIVYQKGAVASAATIQSFAAFCQYIGVWGLEDVPVDIDTPPEFAIPLMHNCRYPNSAWSDIGARADAPVCIVSRRYVGNGTSQIITPPSLAIPFHILVIRNLAASVAPVIVTTTMMGPEQANVNQSVAGDVPIIGIDPITFLPFFQVNGDGNRVNQLGINYEYFIFADPGLRLMINGEFSHGVQTATYNNPLIDGTFTPEFGIFLAGYQAPGGVWLKGPSHTGLEVSTIFGALLSDGVQFQGGNLVTQGGISEQNNATAYSIFRNTDGSNVVAVQIITYVGNGLASRVIPLTPVSGRFPLVVFVVRRNGAQPTVYRDAGHAGVNSANMSNGGNITDGITAGAIDSITVGITCNVNLGQYDVMCFPGTTSGWIEGTYCGPNGRAPGDFWEPDPVELPPQVGVIGEGGLIIGGTSALLLLKNISGIYTLVPGKHSDTMLDVQTGQTSIEMEIPDPTFKTGYVGG